MNGEPASPPLAPSSTNLFEQWPQAATIVTGSTVVLSVFYNWAYFSIADPSAMQLFTIADHISSALQWLPAAILSYSVLYIGVAAPHIIAPVPPFRQLPTVWASVVGVALFLILQAAYLFTGSSDWRFVIPTMLILWSYFVARTGRKRGWSEQTKVLLLVIPLALSYSLLQGNRSAITDFTRHTGNAMVVTKDGKRLDRAVLLRQIDKGVILRKIDDDRVVFLQWGDVKELNVATSKVDLEPRVCRLFNLFCSINGLPH